MHIVVSKAVAEQWQVAAHLVCSQRLAGRQAGGKAGMGASLAVHGGCARLRCAAHLCDRAAPRQRMADAADEQVGEGVV
jgi:hypothetical protein